MIKYSQRSSQLQDLGDSGWHIHMDAMRRKIQGEDIVLLSIGDPDFPTPLSIKQAARAAIDKNRTHYSNPQGEYRLRECLASTESGISRTPLSPENFTVFNGATGALFATLHCIADRGQNIVVPEPFYIGYSATFSAAGVVPKYVPCLPPLFSIDVDEVIETIDDNTAAVLINNPVNPTGVVVPEVDLRKIYEYCCERGVWLLTDEVYSLLCFERAHRSLLRVADDFSNVVVFDSLSKSHAMSGWRLGWAVTNVSLTRLLTKFVSAAQFACNQFVQDAASQALKQSLTEVEHMRATYRARRDYTMRRMADIAELSAEAPEAGMFVMADVHMDGRDFASQLLRDVGVSVVPGISCGSTTNQYVRLSYCQPIETLAEAFNRIEAWFAAGHAFPMVKTAA